MKYYDIHVHYGRKDSDGYSIPIAIEEGDEQVAIEKAKTENRFQYEDDLNCIDYVEEIEKDEYDDMV